MKVILILKGSRSKIFTGNILYIIQNVAHSQVVQMTYGMALI